MLQSYKSCLLSQRHDFWSYLTFLLPLSPSPSSDLSLLFFSYSSSSLLNDVKFQRCRAVLGSCHLILHCKWLHLIYSFVQVLLITKTVFSACYKINISMVGNILCWTGHFMNWLQPGRFLGRLYSVCWICYNWLFSVLMITASSQLVMNWLLLAKKQPFQRVGRTFPVSCVGYKLAVFSIAILNRPCAGSVMKRLFAVDCPFWWIQYLLAICWTVASLPFTGFVINWPFAVLDYILAICWVKYKLTVSYVGNKLAVCSVVINRPFAGSITKWLLAGLVIS